jgi:hypothetical protein
MTVNREPSESDVIEALRVEIGGWGPRQVPNLVELTRPAERAWRRPIALVAAVGAAALAILLLASFAVVALAPTIPGGEVIRAHLLGP